MMDRPLRIAASSVAGASGYSILQCAELLPYPVETYPIDISHHAVGLRMGTQPGTVLPKPEVNIGAWVDFIEKNEIDALIPGADRDLIPLSKYAQETRCIVSRPEVIAIAHDKFKTALYLNSECDLDVPDFCLPDSYQTPDDWDIFPCVVKPRSDAASRGFHKCDTREELNWYLKHTSNAIIQEYISGDEVTANVFVNEDGEPVAHLAMLRKERSGIAIEARPIEDDAIWQMLDRIGRELKPRGTLSVQLRMRGGLPLPFEINARMSGSSIVRAMAGYNDLQMLIDHYVLGKPVEQPAIDYSKTYFRYYGVVAVDTDQMHGEAGSWS